MPVKKGKEGMSACLREWKAGELHSGKRGPVVRDQKQALAICLRTSGQSRKPRGK
jgi:hypothetical protein